MALSDNLEAFLEFQSDFTDSHGLNNLTDINTVGITTGKVGNAASFVAANSEELTIADNASLSCNGTSFTAACWIWTSGAGDLVDSGFCGKGNGFGNDEWALLRRFTTANKYAFWIYDNGASFDQATVDYVSGWAFIVGRLTSGSNLSISVNDGIPGTATHTKTIPNAAGDFRIGRYRNGNPFNTFLCDQFGFWRRAITDAEVTFLYNGGAGRTYAEIAGSPPSVSDYRIIPPTLNFIQPAGQLAIVPATA